MLFPDRSSLHTTNTPWASAQVVWLYASHIHRPSYMAHFKPFNMQVSYYQ